MPGEAYWNRYTVAAVKARYGVYGFDATPYEAALTDGGSGGDGSGGDGGGGGGDGDGKEPI